MSAAEKIVSLAVVRQAREQGEGKKRMQDGFTAVPNDIKAAKRKARLTSWEWFVVDVIESKTFGFNKDEDDITVSQIAREALEEGEGLESVRANVSKAFNALVERNILGTRKGKHGLFVSINSPEMWGKKPAKKTPKATGQIITGVSDHHTQLCQINTHNRQPQETSELPNGSSSADTSAATVACPHQRLIDLYHETLPSCTRVREWNDTRRRMMQTRWREKLAAGKYHDVESGLVYWGRFFGYVAQSPFLTGQSEPSHGRKPFLADLEWLIRPTNFTKVVEGKYHGESAQ